MQSFGNLLRRGLASSLVIVLSTQFGSLAAAQQANPNQQAASSSSQSASQNSGTQPSAGPDQSVGSKDPSDPQQPAQATQTNGNSPVGTAVAPYEKGAGIAASRPAGVVIAPAKQKRTRSFMIKAALVVGAAVAVGTVVALSKASPSEPAH